MLSKKDLQLVRGIVTEVVTEVVAGTIDAKVPNMISQAIEANNHVLKLEIRDEIHSVVNGAVSASESRLRTELHQVGDEIIDVIDGGILPQIEEHRLDIVRLKVAAGIA